MGSVERREFLNSDYRIVRRVADLPPGIRKLYTVKGGLALRLQDPEEDSKRRTTSPTQTYQGEADICRCRSRPCLARNAYIIRADDNESDASNKCPVGKLFGNIGAINDQHYGPA